MWHIREMCKTTTTVEKNIEDRPFVPFSGRPSSIQLEIDNDIGERLVDPEKILKPTINKLELTPWHPEAPPINPPTKQHCVHRTFWEQLGDSPEAQENLEGMD